MGGCQNYGPFLGTLNIRGRIITGIQKGTIILTTTHMSSMSEFPEAHGAMLLLVPAEGSAGKHAMPLW